MERIHLLHTRLESSLVTLLSQHRGITHVINNMREFFPLSLATTNILSQ